MASVLSVKKEVRSLLAKGLIETWKDAKYFLPQSKLGKCCKGA